MSIFIKILLAPVTTKVKLFSKMYEAARKKILRALSELKCILHTMSTPSWVDFVNKKRKLVKYYEQHGV